MVEIQQNFAKIPQKSPSRLLLAWYFGRNTPKFHNSMQLGGVSSEILLKSLQVMPSKYHIMGEIKVLLCIDVRFQG